MALSRHSGRECNAIKQLFTPTFERGVTLLLIDTDKEQIVEHAIDERSNVTEVYQCAKSAAVEAWSALVMA